MKSEPEGRPAPVEGASFVLDHTALSCYLEGAVGGDMVKKVLETCADIRVPARVSALDVLLVYARALIRRPECLEELASLLKQLPIRVEPLTEELCLEAAKEARSLGNLAPFEGMPAHMAKSIGATLVTAREKLRSLPGALYVGPERGGQGIGGGSL